MTSAAGGGRGFKVLTVADKGGGFKVLTVADKGGGRGSKPC